jgi:hypothetical protein
MPSEAKEAPISSDQTSQSTALAAATPLAQLFRFLWKPRELTPTLKVMMTRLPPAAFPIRSQRLTYACSFPRGMEILGGILSPFIVQ